ncbi:MAG TPA: GIY-YIG nuclease family protein [Clostridia bacterium]|nr:GIY-YIG nuclease family protein [Clostridia bacterium]
MPEPGFIYVLINASMPNLLKVGRTTRPPEERVRELNVTAVPTPFILAYKAFVRDSARAEQFVHTYLGTKGYRVSQQREFFNAPMDMVVDAIREAQRQHNCALDQDGRVYESVEKTGFECTEGDEPWAAVLRQADNFLYGFNGEVEDRKHAYELFVQAARLGAPEAYVELAQLHRNGYKGSESTTGAIQWLRKGADAGNRWCWVELADIYLSKSPGHIENARKCFRRFFAKADISTIDDSQERTFFFQLKEYCRLANPGDFDFAEDSTAIQEAAEALLQRIAQQTEPAETESKAGAVMQLLDSFKRRTTQVVCASRTSISLQIPSENNSRHQNNGEKGFWKSLFGVKF